MARRAGIGAIMILLALAATLPQPVAHPASAGEYASIRECRAYIVAVASNGKGVAGNLTVRVAYPGSGKVYISTSPASMVDTQGSARIAAYAASLLAGVDMTRYDFFYDIESNSIIVGGPSAGFAMALATLLALENQTCTASYAVTGMIQPDTSIGPVGGLKEKLEAAASVGAKLFMIPAGQEVYTYYQTKYVRVGPFVYAERKPVKVDLVKMGEELGVRVVSISTLNEAFTLLTNKTLVSPTLKAPVPGSGASDMLVEFVYTTNRTVEDVLDSIQHSDVRFIQGLEANASAKMREALDLLNRGVYYPAALDAVDALSYAYQAMYADIAVSSNLNVTSAVADVNTSISRAYDTLTEYRQRSALNPQAVESLAKAWAKLGIATYYYQKAVDSLEKDNGFYYLPRTFFGGVITSPLELLGNAKSMAVWAMFWANLSTRLVGASNYTVSKQSLEEVARLLEAEARSTTAYLQTLLEEAGAGASQAELPAFLVELASTTNNQIAIIGYSIESISLTTGVIHETFTLDPARTSQGLEQLAATLYNRTGNASLQIPLLLELANASEDAKTRVMASSHAILYGWLTWMLSNETSKITYPMPEQAPQTVTTTTTQAGGTPRGEQTRTGESSGGAQSTGGEASPVYGLVLVVTAIFSVMIGVAIGSMSRRS
ncbi:MAG: hypothetical protein GSR73_05645 [Desulfurococcales archaeon]|nr:hypothetical protein [Desulfurococcales archaeon]